MYLCPMAIAVFFFGSILSSGCRTQHAESDTKDVELQVLADGSLVIETSWYNAFPTQQSQAIHAALDAAGSKLDDLMPGLDIRQQLLENSGEIDFATAVRFGQAILDSEINLPSQFEGLKLGDLPPKGFVILVGGGPLDKIEIREGFDISATAMFTFIPTLIYRKMPGEDELRAYYRFKVGVSVLAVKPIGMQKVAQVARFVVTRGVSGLESVPRPDQLANPLKVGVGLIFGDISSPNQLYSSVVGGRIEFQTSYFTGPLAYLNGGYRAQAIVVNEAILSPVPKALILSLERQMTSARPELAAPHLLLGGNISLAFIVERVQRLFASDLLTDESGEVSLISTTEFPMRPLDQGSSDAQPSQGYEDEF